MYIYFLPNTFFCFLVKYNHVNDVIFFLSFCYVFYFCRKNVAVLPQRCRTKRTMAFSLRCVVSVPNVLYNIIVTSILTFPLLPFLSSPLPCPSFVLHPSLHPPVSSWFASPAILLLFFITFLSLPPFPSQKSYEREREQISLFSLFSYLQFKQIIMFSRFHK